MMMIPPKKSVASIIVGSMHPSEDFVDRGDKKEEDDEQVAMASVAEDILKAITQKNPKALSEALQHFWYICDEDEEPEEMGPEEEKPEGE